MKRQILNHLTANGFVKSEDLTTLELLEKKLDKAKEKLQIAKDEVTHARQELNTAIEESLKKIETNKKELINIRKNEDEDPSFSSTYGLDDVKAKYEQTIAQLELKKNEIAKKIEGYKSDGSEKWDTFKHKLNHDLEELGKALKGFAMPEK
jgi:DNA anti-recombination protein RmuC